MKQKVIYVDATTLDDAWFQLVYQALMYGRDFKIDEGSFAGSVRKEFDFILVHITRPFERDTDGFPLIPQMPENGNIPAPVTKDYLSDYIHYILGSEVSEGESYTYGQRLNREPISRFDDFLFQDKKIHKCVTGNPLLEDIILNNEKFLDQVSLACWTYKNHGHRNNQMCLQVAQPKDMLLLDPPCLRHIDTRIQDGKL